MSTTKDVTNQTEPKKDSRTSKKDLRKEIRGHDTFVSTVDLAWKKLLDHRGPIIVVLLLAVIAGGGWSLYSYFSDQREMNAQRALFLAQHLYDERVQEFSRGVAKALKAKEQASSKKDSKVAKNKKETAENKSTENPEDKGPSRETTGDLEKDYGDVRDGLLGVIRDFPQSKAAVLASLDLAKILMEHKEFAQAQKVLEESLSRKPPGDLLKAATLLSLGSSQADGSDCPKAISTWQKIASDPAMSYAAPDAILNTGLCYEKLNDTAKALESYQSVADKHPGSRAGQSGKRYMRLMKARTSTTG